MHALVNLISLITEYWDMSYMYFFYKHKKSMKEKMSTHFHSERDQTAIATKD